MLDALVAVGKAEPVIEAKAWRIDFNSSADVEGEKIVVEEPRAVVAALTPVSADDVLSGAIACDHECLTILWLPSGAKVPLDKEREAEEWARANADVRRGAIVRAGIRTVRVFWDVDRALIFSSPEGLAAALDAVVRFTVLQRDTLALESAMEAMWPEVTADAPLAHSIAGRGRAIRKHVNVMTEATVRMLASHMRLKRTLEQFGRSLDETSKRIFAEIEAAADVEGRLELLYDPLYFAQEFYQRANEHLAEARSAASERGYAMFGFFLEVAIVIALVIQILQFS